MTTQQIVMKPPLEQTPKKLEMYLPTTGGKSENLYIKWIGLACVVLGLIGAVFAVRKLNYDMKEYEAHSNEVDENPLGFAIGCRNTCILVIPIWTVVFLIGSKI